MPYLCWKKNLAVLTDHHGGKKRLVGLRDDHTTWSVQVRDICWQFCSGWLPWQQEHLVLKLSIISLRRRCCIIVLSIISHWPQTECNFRRILAVPLEVRIFEVMEHVSNVLATVSVLILEHRSQLEKPLSPCSTDVQSLPSVPNICQFTQILSWWCSGPLSTASTIQPFLLLLSTTTISSRL